MSVLRLYLRYAGVSMRGQMQYPGSFLMETMGQFLINGIEFLSSWALLWRFGPLQGWTLPELGLLYGLVNTSFAATDMFSHGFDAFAGTVRNGDFDRILLRPRSTVLQLAGQEVTLRRIGRILQAVLVLAWAMAVLQMDWTVPRCLLLLWTLAGGMALFYGLIMIQATVCFWTIESLEIMNVFTYGGMQVSRFPMSIYDVPFQRFFLCVIPLAAVTYYPALALLGRPELATLPSWFPWLAPGLGVAFLGMAVHVWHWGIAHYRSTGS